MATSYTAFHFRDLMEYVQLLFSLFSAPFFAVLLMGLFSKRTTSGGALAGLSIGVALACIHFGLVASGHLVYGSMMSANFYIAIFAFIASLAGAMAFSQRGDLMSEAALDSLVYRRTGRGAVASPSPLWWTLAAAIVACCALLNYWWR
jgi:SSS family solute:Na+ symporter